MKTLLTAVLLGMAAGAALAQTTVLCDLPAYATGFNSRYEKELALRQRLVALSREAGAVNQARLRAALLASGRVSETDTEAKLAEIAAQPDVVELVRASDTALKKVKSSDLALGALEFVAGPDPVRLARARCLMSNQVLVDVARGRLLSERAAALTQQRLLAFGQERGMVPPDGLDAALRPVTWACASPEGRAAAEEAVALQLDGLRTQQRQSEAALDAVVKAKGWDKQQRTEVFKQLLGRPEFAAFESEKRPATVELVTLMKTGREAADDTSPGACTWPDRFTPTLQKIGEVNGRQYEWMAQALRDIE